MEENNMRRLTMMILAMILVGCASIPTSTQQLSQLPDATEALEELSFRAKMHFYFIENEYELERMLANYNLTLPKFVVEATAQDRKNIDCLARNIYWESTGEPLRGKKAVAQVTLNRTEDERFPADICGVVYERDKVKRSGRMKTICQFSWTCMSVKNKTPRHPEEWEHAQEIAAKFILDGYHIPELDEALFYHADYVRPKWAKKMVKIEKIGAHIFYREKVKQNGIYLASN
jgi:spore germination cell wall hydrolase CwlJ-like protein